jgi:hypothetical protein
MVDRKQLCCCLHRATVKVPKWVQPCSDAPSGALRACLCGKTSVFAKAQIGPNSEKCDPSVVLCDSTSRVHGGHILALTKTVGKTCSYLPRAACAWSHAIFISCVTALFKLWGGSVVTNATCDLLVSMSPPYEVVCIV